MVDVIIVGAGPSGMSAALNLLRAGRSVLILEKEGIGGQIATSPRVENLPSIKEVAGEKFERINDLFAAILEKGVSRNAWILTSQFEIYATIC